MLRRAILVVVLAVAAIHDARADDQPTPDRETGPTEQRSDASPNELAPELVARLRELYDKQDYPGVRRELLAAYRTTNNPALLFALGQVELQLRHFQAAIDYYEQFIAMRPPQDQIDLAQQAIGAARIQLANQKPRRHRYWTAADTVLVVGGGLAIASGSGLLAYGHRKSLDDSGTLTAYDRRLDRVRAMQWTGAGLGAAGLATIAIALVRWRLRPEDGFEVTATASPGGASASVEWRW